MGAIADALLAYAQPLLDETDGGIDGSNHAMALAQLCWNLALLPEDRRDAAIDKVKSALQMTDEEFTEFRQHIIVPMIQRHCEMFPGLHGRSPRTSSAVSAIVSPGAKHAGTGRNAPCPCGSGRKYRKCCGRQT